MNADSGGAPCTSPTAGRVRLIGSSMEDTTLRRRPGIPTTLTPLLIGCPCLAPNILMYQACTSGTAALETHIMMRGLPIGAVIDLSRLMRTLRSSGVYAYPSFTVGTYALGKYAAVNPSAFHFAMASS